VVVGKVPNGGQVKVSVMTSSKVPSSAVVSLPTVRVLLVGMAVPPSTGPWSISRSEQLTQTRHVLRQSRVEQPPP
jgi:hypothetical protein